MPALISELLDSLDQGIAVCDLDRLTIIESNATLTAWLDLPSAGEPLTEYFPETDVKRIKNAINKGRKFRFSKTINIRSRAETVDFNTTVATLSNNNSYLILQGTVNNTATEMKKMVQDYGHLSEKHKKLINQEREKAETANEAKTLFLATMSHEIRTPMNGILGVAQQLGKTPLNTAQSDYLSSILSSGNQLLAIINEILDYSKLESNNVELHYDRCLLPAVIKDVMQICTPGVEGREGIEITTKYHQDHYPEVMTDDIRLKQVLINLVNNAIKFTEQGRVELSLNLLSNKHNECQVEFVVTDTGIGMEKSNIDRLFDAFTQHDSATTRRYGGTGLGLSICSQIVDLMGGKIVASSQLGQGSTFKLLLTFTTVAADEAELTNQAVAEQNNTDEAPEVNLAGKKILVAEDTLLNREVIRMALEDYDVELLMAENGAIAVELFEKNKIDLILMDCLMPVLDGFQASQAIRALEEKSSHVPIIAVTASTSDEINQKCRDSGMNEVMLKPFDFDDLVNKVAHWVNAETIQ